jgi:hypothetical protein
MNLCRILAITGAADVGPLSPRAPQPPAPAPVLVPRIPLENVRFFRAESGGDSSQPSSARVRGTAAERTWREYDDPAVTLRRRQAPPPGDVDFLSAAVDATAGFRAVIAALLALALALEWEDSSWKVPTAFHPVVFALAAYPPLPLVALSSLTLVSLGYFIFRLAPSRVPFRVRQRTLVYSPLFHLS